MPGLESGIDKSLDIVEFNALFFHVSTGVPTGLISNSVLFSASKSLASNHRKRELGKSSGIGIKLVIVSLPVH